MRPWFGLVLAGGLLASSPASALVDVQFGETADGIFGATQGVTGAAVLGGAGDQWTRSFNVATARGFLLPACQ